MLAPRGVWSEPYGSQYSVIFLGAVVVKGNTGACALVGPYGGGSCMVCVSANVQNSVGIIYTSAVITYSNVLVTVRLDKCIGVMYTQNNVTVEYICGT